MENEIGKAARAVAVQALISHREWFDAKELNLDHLYEQAVIYSHIVQDRLGTHPHEQEKLDVLLMSMFAAAFQMGFNVSEGRSLDPDTPNPLTPDVKRIADAGEEATPNQLRQVARLALLREGIV